jgi:hypothetical protein
MRRLPALAASLLTVSVQALAQTPSPPPPPACTAPEHRQFDFWLGQWDVYRTGSDQLVGRNLIEKLYDGCTIRETWTPIGGAGGASFNTWRPDEKVWRQTWVDASNSHADFKGGLQGDAMVIAGRWQGVNGPGTDGYVRITYRKQPDGSVRQVGMISTDDGKTFQPSFDLTYRPSRSAGAQSAH